MKRIALLGFALALLGVAAVYWLNVRGDPPDGAAVGVRADGATLARGAYLARAGNCQDCHTPRGAPPYSGGRGIPTPFGTVYSSNLSADPATGIGAWSATDFRRALHNGRSRDGRLLYPAFPYDAYTRITDADADALFAFLRSQPAVVQPNRPHALRFPYDTQAALAVWRALYFRPGRFASNPARSPHWNRGAYLVQGLGHCAACHAERNALGATPEAMALAGGLIPLQNWYAPALNPAPQPGVRRLSAAQTVELLKTGATAGAAALGPMAEVVLHSTQHLDEADLEAMTAYLQSLPPAPPRTAPATAAPAGWAARGAALYDEHCARCHGDDGAGVAGAYVALTGNPALLQSPPANAVQVVLGGGFAPSTAGRPRPFGMPPFATVLDDTDVAAVLSHARSAWGQQAAPVSTLDVQRYRSSVRP